MPKKLKIILSSISSKLILVDNNIADHESESRGK